MEMSKSNFENLVKVALVGFIGKNLFDILSEKEYFSIGFLVFQVFLLGSIWINHKSKIPLLAIWSTFLAVFGLISAMEIVVGVFQNLLGKPVTVHFEFGRTLVGALSFSLAILVYKVLLKSVVNENLLEKLFWLFFRFEGRANRLHVLVYFVAYFALLSLVGTTIGFIGKSAGKLILVPLIPLLWAFIAVGVKRMHDLGKTGPYLLFGFVPLANAVLAVFILFVPGDDESNEFGPNRVGF